MHAGALAEPYVLTQQDDLLLPEVEDELGTYNQVNLRPQTTPTNWRLNRRGNRARPGFALPVGIAIEAYEVTWDLLLSKQQQWCRAKQSSPSPCRHAPAAVHPALASIHPAPAVVPRGSLSGRSILTQGGWGGGWGGSEATKKLVYLKSPSILWPL